MLDKLTCDRPVHSASCLNNSYEYEIDINISDRYKYVGVCQFVYKFIKPHFVPLFRYTRVCRYLSLVI